MLLHTENDILDYASKNDCIRLIEMIDAGQDVNFQDFDRFSLALRFTLFSSRSNHLLLTLGNRGNTPLHMAASFGQKSAMELLVVRGADINKQDRRGVTPLHILVLKRFDILALWLVRTLMHES
jgi:hypothetical protein